MNQGRTVFAQLIEYASHREFQGCIRRYPSKRRPRRFSYWDQFLAMSFAQLTYRESLRDLEACLGAVPDKLYHMGFRTLVSRTTLADANERRDWRTPAECAQGLITEARRLYVQDPGSRGGRPGVGGPGRHFGPGPGRAECKLHTCKHLVGSRCDATGVVGATAPPLSPRYGPWRTPCLRP